MIGKYLTHVALLDRQLPRLTRTSENLHANDASAIGPIIAGNIAARVSPEY